LSSHLRMLFIFAVIIPCLALAVIAIRSVNREKAFIEIRLQRTLDIELVHTVSVLNAELDRIQDELAAAAPDQAAISPQSALASWKDNSDLIRVPFLLSPELKIVWPNLDSVLTDNERSFLNWNKEFLADRVAIPVYQNVALLYKDEITEPEAQVSELLGKVAREAEETALPPPKEGADKKKASARPAVVAGKEPEKLEGKAQSEQKALSQFATSPEVRQRVYDEARAKGQQTSPRTVAPSAGRLEEQDMFLQQEMDSIYISEPQRFSQITQGRAQGLIPRFMEEKLTLLFWKREPAGGYLGCVLNEDIFYNRMADQLPDVFTPARILTILDEAGRPLLIPDDHEGRDWRRPFAAQEISERLPRWEVAAYLADPDAVASRANLTMLVLWILVAFLFVAIATGGTYILNTLRGEMLLARQKTTFVANVSHELKTPLTSIRMFAEMLKERRQPDPEKQEKYLDLMVSETERLTRLINNVLDFTRMERGEQKYEKKRLDVALLCEALIESQRVRLEHIGFAVSFQNDLGEAFVDGDEESLVQALLNLVSNSEKYSDNQKQIDVDVTGTQDSVLIHVKDRGIGIPIREAKKIFEEFYRVDESLTSRVKGSGLGLPIAHRIIRDHGGDIHYYPRDGGGSVFQIRLPVTHKALS
jgi:signal transduction histidine kinase